MTVKIARYIDGVEVPFEYDNTFGCECVSGCIERLTIGLRGGHSAALALLSTVLSPPYKLLYVLHTSRTGAPLGRYESPRLIKPKSSSYSSGLAATSPKTRGTTSGYTRSPVVRSRTRLR